MNWGVSPQRAAHGSSAQLMSANVWVSSFSLSLPFALFPASSVHLDSSHGPLFSCLAAQMAR